MNLCEEEHGQVCYDESFCPACKAIEDLKVELDDANATIDELRAPIAQMENDRSQDEREEVRR